jgi:hypothetical protein
MPEPVDFHNLAAHHRHNLPAIWQWRQIESLDGGFIQLSGSIPIGTYQSGPRKGRPKFPTQSNYQRVIITRDDVADARARWEDETGLCSWCDGTGQETAGTSVTAGTKYQTCRACGGTGKAQIPDLLSK